MGYIKRKRKKDIIDLVSKEILEIDSKEDIKGIIMNHN